MFPIFYDRVMGYTPSQPINPVIGGQPEQKIIRRIDMSYQENFQRLYRFSPNGDRDRDDYWCRKFLQISRDASVINTIINDWSVKGDNKGKIEQLLKKSPYHLAIALEHYCERATQQVFRAILEFQHKKALMENPQFNQEDRREKKKHLEKQKQRIKAPVGLFKEVLNRTQQPYQEPCEKNFLFTQIELIHQSPVFAQFNLQRNNFLENWAIYRLYKRTADEIIRQYDPERRNNPWRELYHFCKNFSEISPKEEEKRKSELKSLKINENSVNYFTELILVFAQTYVPEQARINGRPQAHYGEPNNDRLQRMAQEFNRRLSLQKNGQEIKNELLGFYQTYLSTDPPLNIDTLDKRQENDDDDGSESTKDVPDYNIPPSPEATELKEQIPDLINQLDNTRERPYQVLFLLEYGFEDELFMAEDGKGNVKLNQTDIGVILGGNDRDWVKRKKRDALTRLSKLIGERIDERELNLDAIAEIKKILEKPLLPDYYFSLIRSWIVDDLAKIAMPRPNDKLDSLKEKVREKITEEIKKAGFDPSPEGLALLEPPISRLVEVYARVTPEQP